MVKCAAIRCRSGYAPTNEEKEMMKRGETPPCKKRVFAFPKNPEMRAQWIAAIRPQDTGWNPDNFGVCELHFKPHDYALDLAPRTKTERKRTRLKTDAIPSLFYEYIKTARPKVEIDQQTSWTMSSVHQSNEEQDLREQIRHFIEEDQIVDLDHLYSRLSNEMLPSGFRAVMMQSPGGDKVLSIRTEEVDDMTGLPVITKNITVYENLSFVMHINGVQLPLCRDADITSKTSQFCSVGEVLHVLARIKSVTGGSRDHLENAAKILDSLRQHSVEEDVRLMATFTAEQLRLVSRHPNNRRYSPFLLSNAIIWNRTSPRLYQLMSNSSMFCLPHSKTLRRLTSDQDQIKNGLSATTISYQDEKSDVAWNSNLTAFEMDLNIKEEQIDIEGEIMEVKQEPVVEMDVKEESIEVNQEPSENVDIKEEIIEVNHDPLEEIYIKEEIIDPLDNEDSEDNAQREDKRDWSCSQSKEVTPHTKRQRSHLQELRATHQLNATSAKESYKDVMIGQSRTPAVMDIRNEESEDEQSISQPLEEGSSELSEMKEVFITTMQRYGNKDTVKALQQFQKALYSVKTTDELNTLLDLGNMC